MEGMRTLNHWFLKIVIILVLGLLSVWVVFRLRGTSEQDRRPEPLSGVEISYVYGGELEDYGIASEATAYDENGVLVGEARCLGIEWVSGEELEANVVVEETQYARDGSGKVVYKGKMVFAMPGLLMSEEAIEGFKKYVIFSSWPNL